jgi:hypothetical protein
MACNLQLVIKFVDLMYNLKVKDMAITKDVDD